MTRPRVILSEHRQIDVEISLVARPGEIQIDRAQVSGGEGTVVPKRECLVLKLPDGVLCVLTVQGLRSRGEYYHFKQTSG